MGLDPTDFSKQLIAYNTLERNGFSKWVFYPGMLFHATEKWWGDGGSRERPHEGLDIGLYQNIYGHICGFGPTVKVPVICKGLVESIIDDYIGKTIYVRHPVHNGKRMVLYTVYGHVDPSSGICPALTVESGTILATIADTNGKKVHISPHLHLSIAWIPSSLSRGELNWKLMGDASRCTLIDPLFIFTGEFTVLDHPSSQKRGPRGMKIHGL